MQFITKEQTRCGVKHKHKVVSIIKTTRGKILEEPIQKSGETYRCCHCGNQDFTITHYPVDPPLGLGNWNDRYHLQCDRCKNVCGMWNMPDGTKPKIK